MKVVHRPYLHRNLGSYGGRDTYMNNTGGWLKGAELEGEVRDELCAGMPGLWCRTLGYNTKIFKFLTGLFVSLYWLHWRLALLMLLLQPLVFSINRKEREQREAIGCCYSATELGCWRGRGLNAVQFRLFTALLTHLAFRSLAARYAKWTCTGKPFLWTKHRTFTLNQGALTVCVLPTTLKVTKTVRMLLRQRELETCKEQPESW